MQSELSSLIKFARIPGVIIIISQFAKVNFLCIFIKHDKSPGKGRCVDLVWKKEASIVLEEDAHQEGHLRHDGVNVDTDDSLW